MPFTQTILDVAAEDGRRPAIVGAEERLTYSELVTDSARVYAAAYQLHNVQDHPPEPAAETTGIPITAVSLTSAFHTSRIIAGLAGFRAVSATIDPRWPLDHQVSVITTTGIGVVISDSSELAAALEAHGGPAPSLHWPTSNTSRRQPPSLSSPPGATARSPSS